MPRMHRFATVHARDNQPTNDQRPTDDVTTQRISMRVFQFCIFTWKKSVSITIFALYSNTQYLGSHVRTIKRVAKSVTQ